LLFVDLLDIVFIDSNVFIVDGVAFWKYPEMKMVMELGLVDSVVVVKSVQHFDIELIVV